MDTPQLFTQNGTNVSVEEAFVTEEQRKTPNYTHSMIDDGDDEHRGVGYNNIRSEVPHL